MNEFLYPFFISTFAGLSTLIGFFFLFMKGNHNKKIIYSLSFAAGVMTSISIIELIPESFHLIFENKPWVESIILCLIFINIGIILSTFINKEIKTEDSLYKVGLVSMIAIMIHNIPEGIATFLTSGENLSLGFTLALSIALHNIPEGISIALPIYYATKSKKKAFLYTFIAGFSESIGAILAYLVLKPWITDLFMGFLYAFIAGLMLHIALTKLLPESFSYKQYKKTISIFIVGFLFMFFLHLFF